MPMVSKDRDSLAKFRLESKRDEYEMKRPRRFGELRGLSTTNTLPVLETNNQTQQ